MDGRRSIEIDRRRYKKKKRGTLIEIDRKKEGKREGEA